MKWLQQYIDYKGITVYSFEKKLGTRSTIHKAIRTNSKLRSDILSKIIEMFGDIRAEWLLTGEGEMLKETPPTQKEINTGTTELKEEFVVVSTPESSKKATEFNKLSIEEKLETLYLQNKRIELQEENQLSLARMLGNLSELNSNTVEMVNTNTKILKAGSNQLSLNFLEIQEFKVNILELKKNFDNFKETVKEKDLEYSKKLQEIKIAL